MHNRNMLRLQTVYCDAEFDETLTSNINYFTTTTKCDVTRINRLYMQYKRGPVSDLVHRKPVTLMKDTYVDSDGMTSSLETRLSYAA